MSDKNPRVLMQARPDYLTNSGGDTIQIVEARAELQAMGIEVDLTTEFEPDLSGYELVHIFNLLRPHETIAHCANAIHQNKPVLLSPIYWDTSDYECNAPKALHPDFAATPALLSELAAQRAQAALAVSMADVLLTSAPLESELACRYFIFPREHCREAPEATALRFFDATPEAFVQQYGLQDFVLCVGRIELRKNQHSLLAALRDTDLPVVIIGASPEPTYMDLCRSFATERVTFIDHIPWEQIPSAYAAARVHVLPSWYDIPGIVSLEAAAAGCNVVTTDLGSTKDYFEDMAWYCAPDDLAAIRQAVLAAWEAPINLRLKEHVRSHFTWPIVAQRTLEAYRHLLEVCAQRTPEEIQSRQTVQLHAALTSVQAQNNAAQQEKTETRVRIAELEANGKKTFVWAKSLEEQSQILDERLQELAQNSSIQIAELSQQLAAREAELAALPSRRLARLLRRLTHKQS
jgi:glycosyltransferase involved in cell wall biosynthesis